MKKSFSNIAMISLALSLLTMFSVFLLYGRSSELVYVDVNKLLEGYKRTKLVRADFDKKAKSLRSNVDSLMIEWKRDLKKYEKERYKYSRKELKIKQQDLANKQIQINSYQKEVQKQIQKEDNIATQTVINDINDYVKKFGKERGYKMIFGAGGKGNIMFADESTDLTDEVLLGLNKSFDSK